MTLEPVQQATGTVATQQGLIRGSPAAGPQSRSPGLLLTKQHKPLWYCGVLSSCSALMIDLSGFTVERVLNHDTRHHSVAVLGRFATQPEPAIVRLSRRPFSEDCLPEIVSGATATLLLLQNDVYSKYAGRIPAEHAIVNVDVTCPATEKHISKHEAQAYVMVKETPALYNQITRPFMDSLPASRIQWVYNILDKQAEADRLLFEDPDPLTGFMLHPDLKWDQTDLTNLYCIAICHRRDVRSLRDLRAEHLPLLRNVLSKGLQAIQTTFGVPPDQVRAFVHYHPSYYHFHVHFAQTSVEGTGLVCGKAHLLDDVIDNITSIDADYYAKRTLVFTIGLKDPLLVRFRKVHQ